MAASASDLHQEMLEIIKTSSVTLKGMCSAKPHDTEVVNSFMCNGPHTKEVTALLDALAASQKAANTAEGLDLLNKVSQKVDIDKLISDQLITDEVSQLFFKQWYLLQFSKHVDEFLNTCKGLDDDESFVKLNAWIDDKKASGEIGIVLAYSGSDGLDVINRILTVANSFYELDLAEKAKAQLKQKPTTDGQAVALAYNRKAARERVSEIRAGMAGYKKVAASNLSKSWVLNKAKQYAVDMKSKKLVIDANGVPQLTKIGIKDVTDKIRYILENPETNTPPITEEMLVQISLYFGTNLVKQVYDRYGLRGDASTTSPFTPDNLRSILVGVAANYTLDDLANMPEGAAKQLDDILCASIEKNNLHVPSERMLEAFDWRRQNEIPIEHLSALQWFGVHLQAVGDVVGRFLFKKSVEEYLQSKIVMGEGGMWNVVTSLTKPKNKAMVNFTDDLKFLHSQASSSEFSAKSATHKTKKEVIDAAVENLEHTTTLEEFEQEYPVFSRANLSAADYSKLTEFYNNPCDDNLKKARKMITKKSDQLLRLGRAEFIAKRLAYRDQYNRDGHVLGIPGRTGDMMNFEVQGVIHDEDGLGVGFYTPARDQEVEGDTIPLIIGSPGTHDLDSMVRDLHPISAGHEEFAANNPKKYRERIITALNDKIADLKRRYPGKKVEIEIFGHSLGGGDTYQLDLMIMEAMAQNKFGKDPSSLATIDEKFKDCKTDSIKNHLSGALRTGLGLEKRDYGIGYVEDRSYRNRGKIDNISLDNISLISRTSDRGAGMSEAAVHARHALTAYLADGSDFKKEEINLHVQGDVLLHTGTGQSLEGADPSDPLFSHVKTYYRESKMGFRHEDMLFYAAREGSLHFVDAHVANTAFNLDTLMRNRTKILSNSPEEFEAFKKKVARPIQVGSFMFAKNNAYRILKSGLYHAVPAVMKFLQVVSYPFKLLREGYNRLITMPQYRGHVSKSLKNAVKDVELLEQQRRQGILFSDEPSLPKQVHTQKLETGKKPPRPKPEVV